MQKRVCGGVRAPLWMLAVLVALPACSRACGEAKPEKTAAQAAAAAQSPRLVVPKTSGAIALDGELSEADWRHAARTGAFLDPRTGETARPYSEARLLHDGERLYLALYAADEDIRAQSKEHDAPLWLEDSFDVRLSPAGGALYQLDLAPNGAVTDTREVNGAADKSWESGVKLAVDLDGTLDDASDDDEEWVVEAALPLASLGLAVPVKPGTELSAQISRCDRPKKSEMRCGAFGAGGPGDARPLARLVLE